MYMSRSVAVSMFKNRENINLGPTIKPKIQSNFARFRRPSCRCQLILPYSNNTTHTDPLQHALMASCKSFHHHPSPPRPLQSSTPVALVRNTQGATSYALASPFHNVHCTVPVLLLSGLQRIVTCPPCHPYTATIPTARFIPNFLTLCRRLFSHFNPAANHSSHCAFPLALAVARPASFVTEFVKVTLSQNDVLPSAPIQHSPH